MSDDFTPAPSRYLDHDRRRTEVFVVAFVGYAACYLVRNNTALVSEILVRERGWTPVQVGLVLTAFTVTYGLGKLVMGVVVDRTSLRLSFGAAMVVSALVCVTMGFLPNAAALAAAMAVIGLVQGACAPAALSTLGAWYPPWQRGSRVAVWNASQNVGAAVLPLMVAAGLALAGRDAWPVAYWLPGLVTLGVGAWVLRRGGDRPWREGYPTLPDRFGPAALPQVAGSSEASYWRLVRVHVVGSRLLLTLAALNALLYLVRFGVLNWIPLYLITERGASQAQAAWVMSAFEWGAIPGALLFALLAHRWPNRTASAGTVGVLALGVAIAAYGTPATVGQLLPLVALMGALTYGPQVVINILTLNFVSPRAMGVAVGFVGLGGYLVGTVVANLGMPAIAAAIGWGPAFGVLAASCLASAALYWSLRRAEVRAVGRDPGDAGRPVRGPGA